MKNLDTLFRILKELQEKEKLNNATVDFNWFGKIVVKEEKNIFRIDAASEFYKRYLLRKFFLQQGLDVFLEETLLQDYYWFTYSGQSEIAVKKDLNDEQVLKALGSQELIDLFNRYSIIGFGGENFGYDKDGKIKIFDWVSDTAAILTMDRATLIDTNGKEIISVKRRISS